jgi:hypothetical protein
VSSSSGVVELGLGAEKRTEGERRLQREKERSGGAAGSTVVMAL